MSAVSVRWLLLIAALSIMTACRPSEETRAREEAIVAARTQEEIRNKQADEERTRGEAQEREQFVRAERARTEERMKDGRAALLRQGQEIIVAYHLQELGPSGQSAQTDRRIIARIDGIWRDLEKVPESDQRLIDLRTELAKINNSLVDRVAGSQNAGVLSPPAIRDQKHLDSALCVGTAVGETGSTTNIDAAHERCMASKGYRKIR